MHNYQDMNKKIRKLLKIHFNSVQNREAAHKECMDFNHKKDFNKLVIYTEMIRQSYIIKSNSMN